MNRTRRISALAAFTTALAFATPLAAKLPPPTDEQKAAAAAAAERAAENAKKDAEALGRSQDRAAEAYAARLKAEGKPVPAPYKPVAAAPASAAPATPAAPAPTASKAPATKP